MERECNHNSNVPDRPRVRRQPRASVCVATSGQSMSAWRKVPSHLSSPRRDLFSDAACCHGVHGRDPTRFSKPICRLGKLRFCGDRCLRHAGNAPIRPRATASPVKIFATRHISPVSAQGDWSEAQPADRTEEIAGAERVVGPRLAVLWCLQTTLCDTGALTRDLDRSRMTPERTNGSLSSCSVRRPPVDPRRGNTA